MSEYEERWRTVHRRLERLRKEDAEEEAALLGEAYDNLIRAYQEARELNDEMECLVKEALTI